MHVAYLNWVVMKLEIRKRGTALAALDDKGNPVMVAVGEVRNYGRGNQVYLPKEWEGRRVVIVDITDSEKNDSRKGEA